MTQDETTAPERAAILRVSHEILAQFLQLPEGAYIDAVFAPYDAPGVIELRIRGAGWPITLGQIIPRASGIVHMTIDEDAPSKIVSIDWGLPKPPEPAP